MRRAVALSTASIALVLAACSQPGDPAANNAVDINSAADAAQNNIADYSSSTADDGTATPTPGASATPEPLNPPAPGMPGGLPDDRTPVSEAPFTPDSAQGAANVVQTYYALLEAGKYGQAYALWEQGAAGMSEGAFAASFAKYREYHANIGAPGPIDAGAGQRYVTVPVQVYGRLKAGSQPFNMRGSVILHRTGDIDGATAAQKSWHIHTTSIKPRPGAAAPATSGALPATADARYRCIDGSRIAVHFDNRADTATVRAGGKTLAVLTGQRPASGIWYKGGGYELRGKGRDATFSKPHLPPLACIAQG